MIENSIPAADKLKLAIDKYGKDNLYKELPDYIKAQYKPESFNNKINRLHGYTFFTDSKLLYEILRVIGISYESLFNQESEESKIAFYLNKINGNIESLRAEQQLNSWFESNSTIQKPTPRTTPIKKLNNVFSIWYINLHLIPSYQQIFKTPTPPEKLINKSEYKLYLNPSTSELLQKLLFWQKNITSFTPNEIFIDIFKRYGSTDRPKLNKLFALIGTELNQGHPSALSFLGINYLLINNLQNYYSSFSITPFQEGSKDGKTSNRIYKQIKLSLNTILKKFDEVIDFIEIRSQVSSYEKIKDAITDSLEQLIKTENFIINNLDFHFYLWKTYITSIENETIQQNEAQVKEKKSDLDNKILELINDLKKIDFRKKENHSKAIEQFRFSVNEMCTGSPFGIQLITPMSKLHYERMMSEKLGKYKLPLPEQDTIIHFENSMIGYLERFKNYRILTNKE